MYKLLTILTLSIVILLVYTYYSNFKESFMQKKDSLFLDITKNWKENFGGGLSLYDEDLMEKV